MHNKLPNWINLKIVIAVAAVELCFVLFETWAIVHSYQTHSEWWPWFFAMIANFPVSIGIFKLVGFIYDTFHVESYGGQVALMGAAFLFIGTLWWSTVLHSVIIFYKYTSRLVGDRKS